MTASAQVTRCTKLEGRAEVALRFVDLSPHARGYIDKFVVDFVSGFAELS